MTTSHPAIAGAANWQRAVCEYIERLVEHYGERLVAVVLYGSRARGDADRYSDIDLLVVLRGEFDEPQEHKLAWGLARELDYKYEYLLLCPVVATEHDYRHRMLPLFMNIRREGIELWPAKPKTAGEPRETYGESPREDVQAILARSRETLDEAERAIGWQMFNLAANRAYYAMFHATTALLLSEGLAFSRHSGVISALGERLVQPGRFPRELGRALGDAFDLRNRADYAYARPVTQEEATTSVQTAAEFVAAAERLLDAR